MRFRKEGEGFRGLFRWDRKQKLVSHESHSYGSGLFMLEDVVGTVLYRKGIEA
jgi:hypothetical protein